MCEDAGRIVCDPVCVCVFQTDGTMALDSDEGEEPSPEAMARYLSMRRHTVGVPDPRYGTSQPVLLFRPVFYLLSLPPAGVTA